MHCNKKLTSKILPNKNSSEAVRLFNEIKRKLESLERPLDNEFFKEDAQTDFIVNIEYDNSSYREAKLQNPTFPILREFGTEQINSFKMQKCFSYVSVATQEKALIVLCIKAFSVSKCTRSRDRTGTALLPLVFETSASTNSAIRAY